MVSDLVFIVLFAALIIQTARVSKWREKYRLEVVRHAVTADEKAQGETIMNDATTTIALATKIVADFQDGKLTPNYQLPTADADWPDDIERRDK